MENPNISDLEFEISEYVDYEAPERLVKSSERVRDLGEVFTPAQTVNNMLDLFPEEVWQVHPSTTFLEPSCGDGNFLIAILARKLQSVTDAHSGETLPAGKSSNAALFHGLEALTSIYAVDISPDNVIGGTPGHEIGARTRILRQFWTWAEKVSGETIDDSHPIARSAEWIVNHNILIGNMLETNPDGTPSGREELPLIEYTWDPTKLRLTTSKTTMGAVISEADDETANMLWGAPEPEFHWSGVHLELHTAESFAVLSYKVS